MVSSAKACSDRFRAPCSHQMSRVERRSWSACTIASIGVTPTPALASTTGRSLSSRMNSPRGAPTSIWSPTRTSVRMYWPAAPCGSTLTPIL